jgi:hypothetical protein
MNYSKKILVSLSSNKWGVRRSGDKRAKRVFPYRDIAFSYANVIATEEDTIYVFNKDNEIEFTTNKLIITE